MSRNAVYTVLRPVVPLLARLLRRVSYAVSIAVFVWLFHYGCGVLEYPAVLLAFPVSVACKLTGWDWVTGIRLFFGCGVGEWMSTQTEFAWHLRATIVVYVPLFYACDLVVLSVRRRRSHAEGEAGP